MAGVPAVAGVPAAPVAAAEATLSGWGGRDRVPARVVRPTDADAVRTALRSDRDPALRSDRDPALRSDRDPALRSDGHRPLIPRGMGRSYGDAAQIRGGLVVDTTALHAFDLRPDAGTVRAQAGVTLGRLLAALQPAGWVLPVVPGTQHVTVGGAIAADIHGKNHGTAGTFATHVARLGLLTADGDELELTPPDPLFGATAGGMGLTGIILWAEIRLVPLPSPLLVVDVDRVDSLDDALAVLSAPGGAHRVAWLDLLGPGLARGVVTRADPARAHAEPTPGSTTVDARLTVPPRWPGGLLRRELVRAYNAYRFAATPRHALGRLEPFGAHMFPLDAVNLWPRLYGPSGFVQYQLVVPRGREDALDTILTGLRGSTVPCYLAVLKDFGPANDFPLSFPLQGWTLALDMPGGAPGLHALLDAFDEIVVAAGGRVYLAKDVRLRPETLAAMYPRLDEWRAVRNQADPEGRWGSDLSRRAGLTRTA